MNLTRTFATRLDEEQEDADEELHDFRVNTQFVERSLSGAFSLSDDPDDIYHL